MTFILEPKALISLIFCGMGLACMLRRTDPIVLLARWGYALRRAIYILGSMLGDAPGEAKFRWDTQRPRDAAALAKLEADYPAGAEAEQ